MFEFLKRKEKPLGMLETEIEELESEIGSLERDIGILDEEEEHYERLRKKVGKKPSLGLAFPEEERKYKGLHGDFMKEMLWASDEERPEIIKRYVNKLVYGGPGYKIEAAKKKVMSWLRQEEQEGD